MRIFEGNCFDIGDRVALFLSAARFNQRGISVQTQSEKKSIGKSQLPSEHVRPAVTISQERV